MEMKLWIKLKEAGMTQRELARQLNISEKTVSQKMRGNYDFRWSEVVLLCDILGIENPLEVFVVQDKPEKEEPS